MNKKKAVYLNIVFYSGLNASCLLSRACFKIENTSAFSELWNTITLNELKKKKDNSKKVKKEYNF